MLSPVFNPDGYEFTFTGGRLWRKTRTPTTKPECPGIDANRNWDTEQFGGILILIFFHFKNAQIWKFESRT